MFESYGMKISNIFDIYNNGNFKNTVLSCGELIEHVSGEIFLNFHKSLKTPQDRQTFFELEKKWGQDYVDFIKRPTTGRSLRYYNQLLAKFTEHPMINSNVKDELNQVNSLRNLAAHAGSNPSDKDAHKALRATKNIIRKLGMLDDTEDTIGLPLQIYLVYSSVKEKFSEAEKGSDFGRIASDAEKLLPELMNLLIDKKYPFLTDEQKKLLIEQFNSQGSLVLDSNACYSFYNDSDLFSHFGKKSSDLKTALEDIDEMRDQEDINNRFGTRPYIDALDILCDELKVKGTDNFFYLVDRIKALYLNDNNISDEERKVLYENAKMVKFDRDASFDRDALDILIESVESAFARLINYKTLTGSEKSDDGDSDIMENLIDMIKLGTPLPAVKAMATQQGFKGNIDELFSKYNVAEESVPIKQVATDIPKGKKIPAYEKIRNAMESFGEGFIATYSDIQGYCDEHFGETKKTTFRTYIISCTVNHATRVYYHPNNKPRQEINEWDVLFQIEKGKVILYDLNKHGHWIIRFNKNNKLEVAPSIITESIETATADSGENLVKDQAEVSSAGQEFLIKRFKDNSIKVFQEDGTAMSGSVKAFLLSIIKQDELDVEIEKKNTRTIGKKVIEALNSK